MINRISTPLLIVLAVAAGILLGVAADGAAGPHVTHLSRGDRL
ncbi:hypothetical protein [Gluconobacter morbifer]|uniref:Uncharacterized protein n=1 Tax=Gluconobacter morbifer G707 TaxID=1088869 RepID=G6XKY4_9PROT|nr:hypothetical protein [Gluconobacter morbifer]EHH67579.1 hypothetical protein GMO_21500 [Gluconobacter morbifer G707]